MFYCMLGHWQLTPLAYCREGDSKLGMVSMALGDY